MKSLRTRQRHKKKILAACLSYLQNDVDIEEFEQNIQNVSLSSLPSRADESIVRDFHEFAPVCQLESTGGSCSFEYDFLQAAVNRGIGRTCLNEFLSVFRKYNVGNFPKDARSCVKSMRKVNSVPMSNGRYYHFGLVRSLNIELKNVNFNDNNLRIQINIDGLPVGKSSSVVFWPILCRAFVGDYVSSVFVVGLYAGITKPKSVEELLERFLNEVKQASQEGIVIKSKTYRFSIHSVVCDAVARQYVKRIISHNGYYACERCVVKGIHVASRGIRYIENTCCERSNDSFKERSNPEHHLDYPCSPFCDVEIDMIRDFPLDYMHLVLLGVVRRLLKVWFGKTKSRGNR